MQSRRESGALASAELVEKWICEPAMGSNAITAGALLSLSLILNLFRAAPLPGGWCWSCPRPLPSIPVSHADFRGAEDKGG